ncbi:MAG TPA: hypothetical protein DER26_07300 [Verrucomicrobia bacterium]|nr:hypothetical protein [Verrucomicrobiota bacterium]
MTVDWESGWAGASEGRQTAIGAFVFVYGRTLQDGCSRRVRARIFRQKNGGDRTQKTKRTVFPPPRPACFRDRRFPHFFRYGANGEDLV